jgi:dimeric dUTPase (all-alpha-NTP-PPase superfamily)
MFNAQEVLNKTYNGENWKDEITMARAEAAILDECSEFLREIEPFWKWWSGKAQAKIVEVNKATYELIDIIHFAMMIILYRFSLDKVLFILDDDFEYETSPRLKMDEDDLAQFTTAMIGFIANHRYSINYGLIRRLIEIIETGGNLLGLKPGQIFEAYQKKNKLNSKRAAPQKAGTYDKSKESELTLGD